MGGFGINTYATPSPVTDGSYVYIHYGTYGTACVDPKTADVIWERRDINCNHHRGAASSPILYKDLLILTLDGIDYQFVTALDKKTGETVWSTPRSTNFRDLDEDGKPKAGGDRRKGFCTPIWREKVGGNHSASLILANGNLYSFNEFGDAKVFAASDTFQILNENKLDVGMFASPAVKGDSLILRTSTHLYRLDG